MAFRFKRGAVHKNVSRLVRQELDAAAEGLRTKLSDEVAVHDARKRLKKSRAVLKLLHDALGKSYTQHNDELQRIAVRLAAIRDAEILKDTFESLRRKYPSAIPMAVARPIAARLDRMMGQRTTQARRVRTEAAGAIVAARDATVDAVGRAGTRRAVRAGLRRAYQRARQAVPPVGVESGPASFHRWRRRVKDFWYQVRLFAPLAKHASRLDRRLTPLEQTLGDEHDLSVLKATLERSPRAFGPSAAVATVIGCIEGRQRNLRRKALGLGVELFGSSTSHFARTAKMWTRALSR